MIRGAYRKLCCSLTTESIFLFVLWLFVDCIDLRYCLSFQRVSFLFFHVLFFSELCCLFCVCLLFVLMGLSAVIRKRFTFRIWIEDLFTGHGGVENLYLERFIGPFCGDIKMMKGKWISKMGSWNLEKKFCSLQAVPVSHSSLVAYLFCYF